jgi:antirestriction protein ArdC
VYNIAQCEGISETNIPEVPRIEEVIPMCEMIVEGMIHKPKLFHKENKAYYNPILDLVNMPPKKNFESDESYYGTLFHELIHSTGHTSRLNRKGLLEMAEFGSEPYSFEELVAEIGACYLESFGGISGSRFEQNVSYINSWLKRLKDDKKLIILASAAAQKATDYILNITAEDLEHTAV